MENEKVLIPRKNFCDPWEPKKGWKEYKIIKDIDKLDEMRIRTVEDLRDMDVGKDWNTLLLLPNVKCLLKRGIA